MFKYGLWSTFPSPMAKMVGGEKVNSKKFKQQGGDGQGNQGHDVSMPIQYYGQKLKRYFSAGSSELNPPNSAYGKTIATSHGVTINENNQFVGPDLGSFNGSIGISGIQTGGGKKKKSARTKMIKNKKLKSVKRGGFNWELPDGKPEIYESIEKSLSTSTEEYRIKLMEANLIPQKIISTFPESFTKGYGDDGFKLICSGFVTHQSAKNANKKTRSFLKLYMNGLLTIQNQGDNDFLSNLNNKSINLFDFRSTEEETRLLSSLNCTTESTAYEYFSSLFTSYKQEVLSLKEPILTYIYQYQDNNFEKFKKKEIIKGKDNLFLFDIKKLQEENFPVLFKGLVGESKPEKTILYLRVYANGMTLISYNVSNEPFSNAFALLVDISDITRDSITITLKLSQKMNSKNEIRVEDL